jgi:hypothetical protein
LSSAAAWSSGGNRFRLKVEDCLEALQLAKNLRWFDLCPGLPSTNQKVRLPSTNEKEENGDFFEENCGFDVKEYEFLDNPLNADLHEVPCGIMHQAT